MQPYNHFLNYELAVDVLRILNNENNAKENKEDKGEDKIQGIHPKYVHVNTFLQCLNDIV